jgi:hypothetical protein
MLTNSVKSRREVKKMKWMEVIKLRIAEKKPHLIEQKIVKLITDVNNNGIMKEIKLYRHAMLDNDVSVHLYWESEKAEPQGSATGLCLLHVLKEFGLISHSVWVEDK